MADLYTPSVTFTVAAGASLSSAVYQPGRLALIGVMSEATMTAPAASPTGEFYIEFWGAWTSGGTYAPIKNSANSRVGIVVQAGQGFAHTLDPSDFKAYPYIKARVVDALGGNPVAQAAGWGMTGTLYEV